MPTDLQTIATQVRRLSLQMTTAAESGHATSSLSCADILTSLFTDVLHFDIDHPTNRLNDRFILSKGHAAPALYAIAALAGWIEESELWTLRQKDSRLEGHPTNRLPFVDVATGSLGQGLAIGMGMAEAIKHESPRPYVFVLMGDGEIAEGSVWEALAQATYLNLTGITAIVDCNALGQSGPSIVGTDLRMLESRVRSFGWETIIVDGHDPEALGEHLSRARTHMGRTCILARTIKGKGVPFLEGKEGWHGKPLNQEELATALASLPEARVHISVKKPTILRPIPPRRFAPMTTHHFEGSVATKEAFGIALADMIERDPDLYCLDADVKNSTMTKGAIDARPSQALPLSIAESTMVGMATGLSVLGKKVVVSTFAAFLTRAFDQLRMAALSEVSLVVNGSYVGASIGRDGASQMGLEDIAMMRSLPGSTVLYPSDAVSTYALTQSGYKQPGVVYLRTTREPTPTIYAADEQFPLGEFKVHGSIDQAKVLLISAGICLHEALKAKEILHSSGIEACVIDLYSVRPLDTAKLAECIRAVEGKVVVIEDHRSQGGIGEVVVHAMALVREPITRFAHLCVDGIPHSASPSEELAIHGIDADAIVSAVTELLHS